jgi:hypothetical protein
MAWATPPGAEAVCEILHKAFSAETGIAKGIPRQ